MPTKFENMIMDRYINTVYGPADDFTQMGIEMAGGTEPEGTQPMSLRQFAETAADVPAGLLKGAVQGTVGLPGDIESLTYGVRELINRGANESMLDAFVRGIETKTILPTTENVKQWLDTNVGPLVPEGADQRRVEAAKTAEFVGELGGAGQTIIEGTRAAARGAESLGTSAVRSITGKPDITTEQIYGAMTDTAGTVKAGASNIISPEIAAKVLPKTKVIDDTGKPQVLYHGTAEDVQEFLPGRAGAIYVSPDPEFAETFTRYSAERKAIRAADALDENPEQKAMFLEPIIEKAMASGDLTSKDFPYHQKLAKAGFIKNLDMYTKDYWLNKFGSKPLRESMDSVGIGNELKAALGETAETGPNILPLYVDAKNPFDYEKPSHIAKVMKQLSDNDPDYYFGQRKTNLKKALQSGSWEDIENTDVQDAIKELGFDAFYIKEQGVKNLGLYKPSQVRSATSDTEMGGLLNP